MAAAERLPRVPQPPHDPRFLMLDRRAGWRAQSLDRTQVRVDGVLTLAAAPGAARSLDEPSGSFGGLVPPSNVAVAGDGTIYLLDRTSMRLLRFDPCCCRFEPVPCFGGEGREPRHLHAPGGIAIAGDDLYVCDTGNGRVQVFSLRGFALRAIWTQPSRASLVNPWTPAAIAFDSTRRAYVADPANLGVHRFSAAGRWQAFSGALGLVRAVTVDCADRVYAVVDGQPGALVIRDGARTAVATDVDSLAPAFPPLPFSVDSGGTLDLCALCARTERCTFDLSGVPVTEAAAGAVPASFVTNGTYVSHALDSRIYRCQWHRVILKGAIPRGTRVHVSTFTAEAELPDPIVLDPQTRWETNRVLSGVEAGESIDCLVMNKGGRYLWLKLELRGDGQRSPQLAAVEIEYPRISLRRYLPAVFGEEPAGADFADRFLSIFDTTLRSIETIIDEQAQFFDPRSAPADPVGDARIDFLSWLATWVGITLDRQWPDAKRREWLRQAGRLFRMRGTRDGLHRQLLLLLGMPGAYDCCCEDPKQVCTPRPPNCAPPKKPTCCPPAPPLILEHFQLRRWLFLGASRIGDQAELWGRQIANRSQLNETAQAGVTTLHTSLDPVRDPFHVYAHRFSVFVPACLARSDGARRSLANLLQSERPAHTAFTLEYVEPRFRIGFQSTIGFNSVVGRYPEGMTLAGGVEPATPLGSGTILTRGRGPSTQAVLPTRVGRSTMLS
jgi:phage tail-like protein